jgi:hypothetical protein
MIILRIPKSKMNQSRGILFESITGIVRYEYKAFMTFNKVHGLYNKRAKAENRIKVVK